MDLIRELLQKKKHLHFTLIDPNKQSPEEAGHKAQICYEYGTDAIMIGDSTLKDKKLAFKTVEQIKKSVNIPTIFFPNSAETIPENVDYIFFMMLLNSTKRKYIIEEQIKGAPLVNKFNIKPISMGYLIISTSDKLTTVEKVCEPDRITKNDTEKAFSYALSAKYLNMECLYLEAGSGAPEPVPNEIISIVKKSANIPLIVGGGIKDGKTARAKVEAGADIIVNGTAFEKDISKLKEIIDAIRL